MRAVIIGTGPAGITAAETFRELDPSGSVVALSAEPYPPYSPPALADHFLTGRTDPLYWKGADVAERLGISERRDVLVTGLDTDQQEVVLTSNERIPYDILVVASGSRLHAPMPGAELPDVYDFKSLRRASDMITKVREGQAHSALIVGNGFIGIELALLLADLRVDVTVIGRRPWIMPRVLDHETSGVAEAALKARGVRLRLGIEAEAFVGGPAVMGVRLAGGEMLTADLYVAATGVKPHTEFLTDSGIATGWGIQVDDRLRASAPGVFAAGDVTEAADWLTGERYVHAIFPNAVNQGRLAALNALGFDRAYDGAEAFNSLKHLGVPIVAMGSIDESDEVLRHQDRDGLRSVYVRDGCIVGAQLAGDITAAGIYRSLMLRRVDVSRFRRRLVEPGFGMADVAWDAMQPGTLARATA
jgi:NAD(P)H-nitrite reductase large subunit